PSLGMRCDLGLGEVADDLAERLDLVIQFKQHRWGSYAEAVTFGTARPARRSTRDPDALAVVGGVLCTDPVDVPSDLAALAGDGFWAVVLPSDGSRVCARFAPPRPAPLWPGPRWHGLDPSAWDTSLDRRAFERRVSSIRESIAAGDVYQVNLTRV